MQKREKETRISHLNPSKSIITKCIVNCKMNFFFIKIIFDFLKYNQLSQKVFFKK